MQGRLVQAGEPELAVADIRQEAQGGVERLGAHEMRGAGVLVIVQAERAA
jgi:hypothetical protein